MFPMMPKPPMKGIPIPSKKKEENWTSGSTEISNVKEQLESAILKLSNIYKKNQMFMKWIIFPNLQGLDYFQRCYTSLLLWDAATLT